MHKWNTFMLKLHLSFLKIFIIRKDSMCLFMFFTDAFIRIIIMYIFIIWNYLVHIFNKTWMYMFVFMKSTLINSVHNILIIYCI